MEGEVASVTGAVGVFTKVEGFSVIETVGICSEVKETSVTDVVGACAEGKKASVTETVNVCPDVEGASVTEAFCGVIDINSDDGVGIKSVMFLMLLTETVDCSLEVNVSGVTGVTFNVSTPVVLMVEAISGKLLIESKVSLVIFDDVVLLSSLSLAAVLPLIRIQKCKEFLQVII